MIKKISRWENSHSNLSINQTASPPTTNEYTPYYLKHP